MDQSMCSQQERDKEEDVVEEEGEEVDIEAEEVMIEMAATDTEAAVVVGDMEVVTDTAEEAVEVAVAAAAVDSIETDMMIELVIVIFVEKKATSLLIVNKVLLVGENIQNIRRTGGKKEEEVTIDD